MENKDPLIIFGNKYILRERIISFQKERHIVFPYIVFKRPIAYYFTWKYPFYKKWLYSDSIINWITRDCIALELDNGKIMRVWYYDAGPSGYSSSTNCESALSEIRRNYFS